MSTFAIPLPGVFPPSRLSRRDARKAKENWNFWFHRFEGRDIMRPHLYLGLIFNHDAIHRILGTGHFNDPNEAGICLDSSKAYHFVQRQLNNFMSNQ